MQKYNNSSVRNLVLLIGIAILYITNVGYSFAFTINQNPGNYESVKKTVGIEEYKTDGKIPKYLRKKSQCGGWDFKDTVAPKGIRGKWKIPYVTGLPGHQISDVFGNVKSGMAVRDENFLAPGPIRTRGYMSACRTNNGSSTSRFRPPFYHNFPCQRPLGDIIDSKDNVPQKPPDDPDSSRPPGRKTRVRINEKGKVVYTGDKGKIEYTCGGAQMPKDGMVGASRLLESGLDGGLCGLLNNNWLYGYYEVRDVPMDAKCRDSRKTRKPQLENKKCNAKCTLTRYSSDLQKSQTPDCRLLKGKDPDGNPEPPEIEVQRLDKESNQVPKDPVTGEDMTFVEVRGCCTWQNNNRRYYGPEGPGDPTGDNVDFVKNCEVCDDEECRYVTPERNAKGVFIWPNSPEPPRPRYQYYPPWKSEIFSKGCEICRDIDGKITDCCGPTVETSGEFPCAERFLKYYDPDIPNSSAPVMQPGYYRYRKDNRNTWHYRSFFRHYTASYTRAKVKKVPNDDNAKWDIPVSCYRLYSEKDPLTEKIQSYDKVCVIAAYYYNAKNRNFGKMKDTQEGKGDYLREMEDIDAVVRNTDFDEKTDMWYPGIGNAFSLSNGKILEEKYNDDITMLLTQPTDKTHLESTIQLMESEEEKSVLSKGALLRAFDDTVHISRGDERTMAEWWQEQETQIHTFLNPPAIKMLLPPLWSIGLDPLDPIFTPKVVDYPSTIDSDDPRMQVLEVQLKASEDTIDTIKTFLKNSLLPTFKEEPIPILVPMGSPTEFRALAERWRAWIEAQNAPGKTPSSKVKEAEDLALMLEYYALQIEEVRKLRTELSWFNQRFFDMQKTITNTISQWLNKDVIAKYTEYRNSLERLESIRKAWQDVQEYYRKFHDKTSMPWCHNERYSLPIYSLLDPYFPGRPKLDGGDWKNKPNAYPYALPSISTSRKMDSYFDFTALKPSEGIITIPVVQPIQVQISLNVLEPPGTYAPDIPGVPILPDFPPIPSISDIVSKYEDDFANNPANNDMGGGIYPEVVVDVANTPPGINITPITEAEIVSTLKTIKDMETFIRRISKEYDRFWTSQTMSNYDHPFPDYTEQDCYRRGRETCVHSEMDLLERMMRFGTRPAVILREDHLSIGWFRPNPAEVGYGFESCPENDWTCQLLNKSKTYPATGWSIDWPTGSGSKKLEDKICPEANKNMSFIDQLRVCSLKETLERPNITIDDPEEQGDNGLFPYNTERNDIIPSFEIPSDFDLIPDYKTEN